MKKLFLLILALVLILSAMACSSESIEESEPEELEPELEVTEPKAKLEVTEPEPEPEIEIAFLSPIMTEREFNDLILTFSEDIRHSVRGGFSLVLHFTEKDYPRLVIYPPHDTELTEEHARHQFSTPSVPRYGDMERLIINGKTAFMQFYDNGRFAKIMFPLSQGMVTVDFHASADDFLAYFPHVKSILGSIQEVELPTNDLFMSEDRQEEYRRLINSFSFKELEEFLIAYIEEYEPDERDSVFEALAILERMAPALEQRGNFIIIHDDFDNSYTLKFRGANEISRNTSIDVTISSNPSSMNVSVGFVRSGWLFFDRIEIRSDGEVVISTSHDHFAMQRDVLRGGTIREYLVNNNRLVSRDVVMEIYNAENTVIRFENRTNRETFDHTFTAAEVNALYYGFMLREGNSDLIMLLRNWNN